MNENAIGWKAFYVMRNSKKFFKKNQTKLSYKTPFQDLSGNLFKINLLLDD